MHAATARKYARQNRQLSRHYIQTHEALSKMMSIALDRDDAILYGKILTVRAALQTIERAVCYAKDAEQWDSPPEAWASLGASGEHNG